jgi:hypothetical protein
VSARRQKSVTQSLSLRLDSRWFCLRSTRFDQWLSSCLRRSMNRTALHRVGPSRLYHWRYYLGLAAFVMAGPVVLAFYAFAVWCLAASIDLIHSFPWSSGPLSNWMIWLAVAVLLNLAASGFLRRSQLGTRIPPSKPWVIGSMAIRQVGRQPSAGFSSDGRRWEEVVPVRKSA